jgi:hypothetical protein
VINDVFGRDLDQDAILSFAEVRAFADGGSLGDRRSVAMSHRDLLALKFRALERRGFHAFPDAPSGDPFYGQNSVDATRRDARNDGLASGH